MLSQKNKYFLFLILLNGLLVTLLIFQGRTTFEDIRPIFGLAAAMAMFLFYELFFILFAERKRKSLNARQLVNYLLAFKSGKVLLTLLFIAIYAIFVKVELKKFAVAFIILYFIYLILNTVYLANPEKDNKKEIKE
jgi:F0F1-type ATP synthase assembly protein I